jgi:hypothetical protein
MKNKLSDLNDHLFAELERLGDEDLQGDALQAEITRAKAITDVATQAIANASLVLKAEVMRLEYSGTEKLKLPALLGE